MSRKSGITHLSGVECLEVKEDQAGKNAFGVGTFQADLVG